MYVFVRIYFVIIVYHIYVKVYSLRGRVGRVGRVVHVCIKYRMHFIRKFGGKMHPMIESNLNPTLF